MSTNPFRLAERIARAVGAILLAAFGLFCVGVVLWAVSDHFGLGWWGLLLIPGLVVAFAVLAALGGLIEFIRYTVRSRWRGAKRRWDERHPAGTEEEQ